VPAERHVCVAIRTILTTMVRPYQAAGAQICELADLGTASALYDMPPGRVKKDRAVIVPLSDLACTIPYLERAPKRSHLFALRATKISAYNQPSDWSPNERVANEPVLAGPELL
jgi:hypothetical protein